MSEVVNVKNPRALLIPEVQALCKAAIEAMDHIVKRDWNACAPDLFNYIQNENLDFIMGMEDGKPRSLILLNRMTSPLTPRPTIVTFYNEGSKELRDKMKDKLLDTLVENGYSIAWAINGSGRSDKAWERVFGNDRNQFKRIGSFYEVSVR